MEKLHSLQNNTHKKSIFESLQKQVAYVLLIVVVVAMGGNLALLTYLGPKGEELGEIRRRQEELKLENDLLRSQLEQENVYSQIEEKARNELKMNEASVTVIKVSENNLAQTNE
ncbi:MAG TPA: hypothetical protein VGA67_01475 [Candidatus Dojkabacteria bacterium]|jgi:cell division protein FtsB